MIATVVVAVILIAALLGFVWWQPLHKKLVDEQTPAWFNTSDECKIAVHEAGHAVTAWCCTIVGNVKEAGIWADGGAVKFSLRYYDSSDVRWCNLVLCMAGAAAEIAVFGKVKTIESRGDLLEARTMAEELVGKGDGTSPWRIKSLDSKSLPFAQIYVPPITSDEEIILRNAYATAKDLVRAHGDRFYRLVRALMVNKTMSEKDLEKILHKRAFARLVGMLKPTFLVPGTGRPVKTRREAA